MERVIVVDGRDEAPRTSPAHPRVPCVVVVAPPRAHPPDPEEWWFPEASRVCVETPADAFAFPPRLADAIAWATSERVEARSEGPARLVCIGATRIPYGEAFELDPDRPVVLGRSRALARPDVHVGSSNVAPRHAELVLGSGGVQIRDLKSTNGTLIVRRGQPGRLLGPSTYLDQRAAPPWFVLDPTAEPITLAFGDEIVVPGFARFRLDGQLAISAASASTSETGAEHVRSRHT